MTEAATQTADRVTAGRHAAHLVGDIPRAVRMRIGMHRPVPAGFAEGAAAPVVLLPGVQERWPALVRIARRLSADGHPVHVLPELGYNVRPIPETAERVLEGLARRDLSGVVLVAHSKGGLVGKHAMLHDADGRIDRMVAVATPFRGTRMADLMVVPWMREFRREHPVIRALAADERVDDRIVSIAPRFDPHIPDRTRVERGRNVEVPVVGHFRILEWPAAIDAVARAVAG